VILLTELKWSIFCIQTLSEEHLEIVSALKPMISLFKFKKSGIEFDISLFCIIEMLTVFNFFV